MNEQRLQAIITSLVDHPETFQALEEMVAIGKSEATSHIVDAVRAKEFDKATSFIGSIDGMDNLLAAMKHVAVKYRGKKAT